MLTGVFHLHEQEARNVMTPIPAVVTVDVAETVEAALSRCVETGHSRLVVTEDENQDRVKGIVHVNQLVKLMMNQGGESQLRRAGPRGPAESRRPSRWTTCWLTSSASAPNWPS